MKAHCPINRQGQEMAIMIDEDTKQIIIKKTWCHGQLVAPVVGLLCFGWAWKERCCHSLATSLVLISAAIILPVWSVVSFRAISTQPSFLTLLRWGIFVEISYLGIFIVSSKQLHETWNLIMFIASGLLFIETLAFLAVVTAFRTTLAEPSSPQPSSSSYTDFVEVPAIEARDVPTNTI